MFEPSDPRCSFCGKPKSAVDVLISGPNIWICDSCVDRMAELVRAEKAKKPVPASR